jgi:ATP-dependent protease ClpP protease subunit
MNEFEPPSPTHKPKFFAEPAARIFNFYLCGEIKEAEEYIEWFQILRSVGENDIVYIRINSEGGDLFSALQLVRAIQESNATIVCSVEGICMSAATLIFLTADQFELSDHTMFMFHNYSSGTIGKGGEMYDQLTHFRAWSEKLFASFYKDFLTPEEIKSMLDNKDIWLDAEEVAKRLKNRIEADAEEEAPKPKKTRKKAPPV